MQSLSISDVTQSILVPSTTSSLNITSNVGNSTTSRKRKSIDCAPDSNSWQSDVFTARTLSSKPANITFASVTLVARACLPLAWLNISAATSSLVLQASIPFVEEWEQRVLVVRKVLNGGLYAIEQVAIDTYVACALQGWVPEAWCHDAAIGRIASAKVEDILLKQGEGLSRTHSRTPSESGFTALPTPKSPKQVKNRRGALARMSILAVKDRAVSLETTENASSPSIPQQPTLASKATLGQNSAPGSRSPTFSLQPIVASSVIAEPLPITPAAHINAENLVDGAVLPAEAPIHISEVTVGTAPSGQTPNAMAADIDPLAHERLQTQYFERLYTSKTSLAFYVKGPLSRARAHVRYAEDPAMAIDKLSDFYEHSILPTKKVDLKYKESVVKVVQDLAVFQPEHKTSEKKKSRKKKMKLGKDCLWTDEDEFVAKWWRTRDIKGTVAATDQAGEMRKELADLRMRETKMQMLLMLEVMLLESASSKLAEPEKSVKATNLATTESAPSDKAASLDPNVKVESVEGDIGGLMLAGIPQKPPRPKKKRDWFREIDTIVDRLCIWHTVSLDGFTNMADENSSKSGANGSSASKPNDALRDFCKDVLLPFYSAKLPEQVKSMCRKLGGPEISPKRPTQARPVPTLHRSSSSISSLPQAKPGQPISKRTLERVLSEDHHFRRHASPPVSLSRSNSVTAPIIPTFKREPSERPISRGGMLSKSLSFSNREIDLVGEQKVHEAKRRKLDRLAQQKKELEAAIDALKKPDRRTVATQIMDEVEERKRLEQEKKMAVQISATPRAKKVKGQVAQGID